jgi:hypothetical protein
VCTAALVICVTVAAATPFAAAGAAEATSTGECGFLGPGVTTWTPVDSPYLICPAGIMIETGSTLLIQAGSSALHVTGGPIGIVGGVVRATATPGQRPAQLAFTDYEIADQAYDFRGFLLFDDGSAPGRLQLANANVATSVDDAVAAEDDSVVTISHSQIEGWQSALSLDADATATVIDTSLHGDEAYALDLDGSSSASITGSHLVGGPRTRSYGPSLDPAVEVTDRGSFNGECDTITGSASGLITSSTAVSTLDDSDIYGNEASVRRRQLGSDWYDIGGTGPVVADRDAWSAGDTGSYGPADGQIQDTDTVSVANSVADAYPRAAITVTGPVDRHFGESGAGRYSVRLSTDRRMDTSVPPIVVVAGSNGVARRIVGTWTSNTSWQGSFVATPDIFGTGFLRITAGSGAACTGDAADSIAAAAEVVHVNDHAITPALRTHWVSDRQTKLSWKQRGEQSGTTFAVRAGVKSGTTLRWVRPAAWRRLRGRELMVPSASHETSCYEVRATAFHTTSGWSRLRCRR